MSLHFVSGVPKTTLRLIDSLEVFTELRSYYIHDYSLLHERYIKINKEKRNIGQIQRKPGTSIQVSSLNGVMWDMLNSPNHNV